MVNLNICRTIHLPSGGALKVAEILSAEQLPAVDHATSQHRQCEGFTWRELAREMLQSPSAEFIYNDLGAPQIHGSDLHISVSHSATLVAVIISPERCAVDIENINRNFERVASRYVSEGENLFNYSDLWSVKEALYKYAGRAGLQLRDQIRVCKISEGNFQAQITPSEQIIEGHVQQLLGHTLAYIG